MDGGSEGRKAYDEGRTDTKSGRLVTGPQIERGEQEKTVSITLTVRLAHQSVGPPVSRSVSP